MQSLLDFIDCCPSPYHVVEESKKLLKNYGFKELDFAGDNWRLTAGEKYYTCPYGTTLFAFTLNNKLTTNIKPVLHMAAAHTDFPCLRIKPAAEMTSKDYLKLNVEGYGGLIVSTWLDRPLSIAGRIALCSNDVYKPAMRLIDFNKPLLTIPNLAIHLNKDINKGIEINKQTELSPIIGMLNDSLDKESFFIDSLAATLNVNKEDILDFDLYIYAKEQGTKLGLNEEFISAPRLDNLTSVYSLLYGITNGFPEPVTCGEASKSSDINIIALYDNEEIGSRSKQGADSLISNILIKKIYKSLGYDEEVMYNSIMNGLMLSVDVSHGFHPNYESKNDPVLIAKLTGGVVLKFDSTQKYASDTEALAIACGLCKKNNIPYQKFANRSDATSGSTLGSIISKWLPMKTVDLGVPLLAMHSAREMMGAKDQESLNHLMKVFFN